MQLQVTEEDIVNDLQRLDEEIDGSVTMDDYREQGRHAMDTVLNRFESWNDAKRAAGLDVIERNVSDWRLMQELRALRVEMGETPTEDDMNEEGAFSSTTYQRAFHSWNNALRIADDMFEDLDFTVHRAPGNTLPM